MQLNLVAYVQNCADTQVSRKEKLLAKAQGRPKNFTWDEAVKLMGVCGFRLLKSGGGSARMFVHDEKKVVARLHEPHPQNTLLPYMVEQLLEALRTAGELE